MLLQRILRLLDRMEVRLLRGLMVFLLSDLRWSFRRYGLSMRYKSRLSLVDSFFRGLELPPPFLISALWTMTFPYDRVLLMIKTDFRNPCMQPNHPCCVRVVPCATTSPPSSLLVQLVSTLLISFVVFKPTIYVRKS